MLELWVYRTVEKMKPQLSFFLKTFSSLSVIILAVRYVIFMIVPTGRIKIIFNIFHIYKIYCYMLQILVM